MNVTKRISNLVLKESMHSYFKKENQMLSMVKKAGSEDAKKTY
jgi:hypothetical protein